MNKIAIIGSTGSIGQSTLDVVRQHPDCYQVVALAAGSNHQSLAAQIAEFKPRYVALNNQASALELQKNIDGIEVRAGCQGVSSLAELEEVDIVVLAVVGIAGLAPALAAIRAGKRLALANKEVLVSAGPVIMAELQKSEAQMIPVDSEHSAIFQCMQGAGSRGIESIERLILTASGGPFRTNTMDELAQVTRAEALDHPTWKMGAKITIDSATLMNKGLEVIEACWLFGFGVDKVDVVVHPQSIIHSMVEYCDGATLAQMSPPDMRLAIQYALSYPERIGLEMARLDLAQIGQLTFFEPDFDKFPCLGLAYEAMRQGGIVPALLNATNEVAVDKFLAGKIKFNEIAKYIEKGMSCVNNIANPTLEDIIQADKLARQKI